MCYLTTLLVAEIILRRWQMYEWWARNTGSMILTRAKPKFSEENLSHYHFVRHKSPWDWTWASAVKDGRVTAWPMARPQQIIKPLQNRLLSHIARPKCLQKCTVLFRPVSCCALICTVPKHRPLWCQPVWELQVGLTYLNLRCRCWMI
jgi:hypothetical protein